MNITRAAAERLLVNVEICGEQIISLTDILRIVKYDR